MKTDYETSTRLITSRIFNLDLEIRKLDSERDITGECEMVCRKSSHSAGVYNAIVWHSPFGDKDVAIIGDKVYMKPGFRMTRPAGATISYRILKLATPKKSYNVGC
jgi:hypothetical protein